MRPTTTTATWSTSGSASPSTSARCRRGAQVSGPAVTLDTSNPLSPSFLTPNVPAAGATLTFRLTVTCPDGSNGSNDGTVSVIDVNRPPVAYASAAPPIVYAGDAVTLHSYAPAGSPVSNDPDGDSLTYLWTRTAGPVVTLANATTPTATFTAPVTGGSYTLQFQLRISDGRRRPDQHRRGRRQRHRQPPADRQARVP